MTLMVDEELFCQTMEFSNSTMCFLRLLKRKLELSGVVNYLRSTGSEIIESVFYKSMTLLIIARDTSYVMHCKDTDFFLISNYELMKSLVLRKGS